MTNIATGRINFGPIQHSILNSTLGYKSMFDKIETLLNDQDPSQEKYPPHNIIKLDEYNYVVELAVAGFSKKEIDITITKDSLIIKGAKVLSTEESEFESNIEYLHKGISSKSFTKTITMADTVELKLAKYEDGILRIFFENVIPEYKKDKKVEIK